MITEALTRFAADVSWRDLPADVRDRAKLALLDHLACASGGAVTDWGRLARNATLRWGDAGRATVLGEREPRSPPTAAFLNGHFGNMLDFDDTLRDLGHPGTCILPAALAVAEQEDRSGEAFLEAVVAGYEVAGRYAAATRPDDASFREVFPTGWHGLGPAVAAARLLGPDADGIRDAVGVAAELVPASTALTRETTYAFKSGKMGTYAATGVRAAYAAAEGLHGKRLVLDPETPYWRAFGSNRYDADVALDGLGERFALLDLSFKPYPSCRFTHGAVEATLALRAELGPQPEGAVRRIEVRTFGRALQLDEAAPANAAHGPFCFPYVVAVAWLGVPPTDWYAPATREDGAVVRLARRVRLEASGEFDDLTDRTAAQPSEVSVELADGRTASRRVLRPLGDPERPLSSTEVERKFATFATPLLGAERAERVRRAVDDLDRTSVRALTSLLRPDPKHPDSPER